MIFPNPEFSYFHITRIQFNKTEVGKNGHGNDTLRLHGFDFDFDFLPKKLLAVKRNKQTIEKSRFDFYVQLLTYFQVPFSFQASTNSLYRWRFG